MLLDRLGSPRIAYTFIRRFPAEETRRRFGDFEEAFGSYISPTANVANLPPNAPPDAPRFVLQSGKKNLVVSNTIAQLNLDFSEGIPKGYNLRSSLLRAAEHADKMDRIFSHQTTFYCGVVVTATAPYKSSETDVLSELYKAILGRDPEETLASLTNTIGVVRDGFNIQTSVGQYKMVEAQGVLPMQGPQSIHIDFDFTPSSEEGLEFKWDVNTKPRMKAPDQGQFRRICNTLADHVENSVDQPWHGIFADD